MSELLVRTREALDLATAVVDRPEHRTRLQTARLHLDGPLRVAIVGRMKAGKSTILNAIVGDRVAPTDTTECTRVITEYRHGLTYSAVGVLADERRRPLLFERGDAGATIDLGGLQPRDYLRIEIEFPSVHLRDVVLVDTPGVTSLDAQVGAMGSHVTSIGRMDLDVDVAVCVMRQLDPTDVDLLEGFRTPGLRSLSTINAIAVLARADEIDGGSPDAMRLAREVATVWQRDRMLQRMVGAVMPVSGLLAESSGAMSEPDFRALWQLAERLTAADGVWLASVDHLVERASVAIGQAAAIRLARLLGLHGLLKSLRCIRLGMAQSTGELCARLRTGSGIEALRAWVFGTLVARSEVLKAQRALDVVADLASETPEGRAELLRILERVTSGSHEFAEIAALNRIRADDDLRLPADVRAKLWSALGGNGTSTSERLGSHGPPDDHDVASAIEWWSSVSEDPICSPDVQRLARLAARSLGGAWRLELEATPGNASETEPHGSDR